MKEIQNFSISQLQTDKDFGFHKQVEAELVHLTLESDQAMVANYKTAISALEAVIKPDLKNTNTEAVTKADDNADATWRGLRGQVKALVNFPRTEKRLLANKALAIIDKYGDITNLSYNEEYGNMHNLLNELDALGAENHLQLHIEVWLEDLHLYYNEFMAATAAYREEKANTQVGAVKQNRINTDNTYRELVKRVNALSYVGEHSNYATFIDNVNVLINQEKRNLASRKTRNESESND